MEDVKVTLAKEKEFWDSLGSLKAPVIIFWILMLIPIFLYALYFSGGITSEHQRWSEFGDYFSGIAGMLNVITFVVLTILIHTAERKQAEKSTRYHAEEFIIKKIQEQLETLNDLYIPFQHAVIETKDVKESKVYANETFEVLQPFMTYLYYLKNLSFLPKSTIKQIGNFHAYLFDASDILLCYSQDIGRKNGKPVEAKDVLRVYREIYRFLEELDVTMTSDIADFVVDKKESTNYREKEKIN